MSEIINDVEKDREAILEVHQRYMAANATTDSSKLPALWDDDPSNVYFNLSGHNYRGLGVLTTDVRYGGSAGP